MLTIALKENFDPYEMARNVFKTPKTGERTLECQLTTEIERGKVTFSEGDPPNGILNVVMNRPIRSVSNAKTTSKASSYVEKAVGISPTDVSFVPEVLPKAGIKKVGDAEKEFVAPKVENMETNTFPKRFTTKPRRMSLWMIDFGVPVGGEFGYPHPAILYEETSRGLWNVIPCSTKYREGKESIVLSFNDTRVLKNKSPEFYAQQFTHAYYKELQSVSEKRFNQYLGDISDEYAAIIEKCYQKGNTDVDVPFTLETLSLSEKQIKLLCGKEKEAIEIGNSEFSYEDKVKKILNLLGFYPDAEEDATYLFEAIKMSRVLSNIDSKQLFRDISKGKLVRDDIIQSKVTLLLKKKYKDLYPCFEAFLRLINMIAYYH